MRASDPTDTGLELDVAGSADDVVALIQRAVERSGAEAGTTRHYVAIDGGTSADIRLRVASIDDQAPLLSFAITTARSAKGTAAASFILQHSLTGRRRQRALVGEEHFVAFLRSLAGIAVDDDPAAVATLRVQGARTLLGPQGAATAPPVESAPRAEQAPSLEPQLVAQPQPVPSEPTVPSGIAAQGTPPVPATVPETPPTAPAASNLQAPGHTPALPVVSAAPVVPVAVDRPTVVAAPAASTPTAAPPVVPAPPASSAVGPELQITVPPGLIAAQPDADPAASAPQHTAAPAPAPHPTPSTEPTRHAAVDATVLSGALRDVEHSLELPGGEQIPLRGAVLLGRNPAARPEHAGAELRAIVDPRMSVSKTHTAIVPGRRTIRVTDLHSTNGTTVTDTSGAVTVCVPGESYTVEAGWTIGIGDFPIRVVR
ncbi:FHA domain-containing protein [Plantibacter flavus]|uniref:FHA domain-containing protein n=1 Tax=Plantibacter flavus TaxID=150123 RepID=UPI003F182970